MKNMSSIIGSTRTTRSESSPVAAISGAMAARPNDLFPSSSTSKSGVDKDEAFPILRLPHCVISIVLKYLAYDQVSQMRVVCKTFNQICQSHLNNGFRAVERFHFKCQKEIKAKLPRRESVRRNHPYARHSDILSAIETRISLLSMTFMKYVEMKLCCFIPGKVIDEIYRVLRVIKEDQHPPRAYEILQELRDISSMAMEYFDEKIVPGFKLNANSPSTSAALLCISPSKIMSPSNYMSPTLSTFYDSASTSPSTASSSPIARSVGSLVKDMVMVQHKRVLNLIKRNQKQFTTTQKAVAGLKGAQNDQRAKITALEKCVAVQENLIKCQSEKLKEQEAICSAQVEKLQQTESRLSDMTKALADFERRLSEMSQQNSNRAGRKRKASESNKEEKKKPKMEVK